MDSEQCWGESVFTVCAKKILATLERNNFGYLISALLMLVGCYIVCLPYLFVYQTFDGLVVLLTVINLYELLVIAACTFIIRKLPQSGESATLLFVELLFLLDATCTINGCIVIQFWKGALIMGVSLAAAIAKMYAMEAAARAKVFEGLKAVLLPAVIFTLSFQPLLVLSREIDIHARQMVSYALWLLYGTLPLLLLFTRADLNAPAQPDQPEQPVRGWHSVGLRRAMLVVAIVLPGYQLGGQLWVYRAPFSLSYLLPLFIALLTILPVLFKKLSVIEALVWRIVLIPSLLFAFALLEESAWPLRIAGHSTLLSPLRLNLAFAACAFLVMWMREDHPIQLSAACILATLALMGHDGKSIASFCWDPDWLMLAASIPIACLWLSYRRGYWRTLAIATLYLFCIANGLTRHTSLHGVFEAECYWPILAFSLSLAWRVNARPWQLLLLAVVFVIGVLRYTQDDFAALIYFLAAFGTLCAARSVLKKNSLIVIGAYFVAAGLLRFHVPSVESNVNWGWVVIALAFLVFGGAFLVTHLRFKKSQQPPELSTHIQI
jgi:hypothetical protein